MTKLYNSAWGWQAQALVLPESSTLSLAKPPGPSTTDSTGLQIVGEGPWAAAKHGARATREWRRGPVGADVIVVELTKSEADDLQSALDVVNQAASECVLDGEMPFVDVVEWFEYKLWEARGKAEY